MYVGEALVYRTVGMMDAALAASGNNVNFLRYKGLDHQLEDSDARIEMLTQIGQLLDRTIGH